MKLIGTITIPQEGQGGTLEFAKFIPDGVQCEGLRLRVSGPLKNIGGAGYTPDATDLLNWVKHVFASLLLSYGDGDAHVILAAIGGALLRTEYRFMEEEEFPTDVITGGAIGAGATATRKFSIYIPFTSSKHPTDDYGRMGSTQLRTMKLTVNEDGNKTIKAAQLERGAGNVTIDVVPNFRAGPDTWAAPLTVGQSNVAELEVEGEDGLTVAAWDENATTAATTLTRFSATIGGKPEHEQIEPVFISDEYNRQLDQGGANISDTVTPLYVASKQRPLYMAPHGRPKFRQNTQELTSWKLRQLYFPVLDDAEQAEAALTKAKAIKGPVLATRLQAPAGSWPGAPACMPVRLYASDAPEFHTLPGIVADQDGNVRPVIPGAILKAALGRTGATTDAMEKDATARNVQKVIAKHMGAVNTAGNKAGTWKTAVQGALSGLFK